jgi:hypothetical protein
MISVEPSCFNRFFHRKYSIDPSICLRYPPVVIREIHISAYPQIKRPYYCGEWKRGEERSEEDEHKPD